MQVVEEATLDDSASQNGESVHRRQGDKHVADTTGDHLIQKRIQIVKRRLLVVVETRRQNRPHRQLQPVVPRRLLHHPRRRRRRGVIEHHRDLAPLAEQLRQRWDGPGGIRGHPEHRGLAGEVPLHGLYRVVTQEDRQAQEPRHVGHGVPLRQAFHGHDGVLGGRALNQVLHRYHRGEGLRVVAAAHARGGQAQTGVLQESDPSGSW
mmetsp:Transcript_75428/g.201599  ORF Transcript_75428/g.201599 Transcript_75428/m.201599 type:complete len:207 (-) Transcript_75428:398-1018(-)